MRYYRRRRGMGGWNIGHRSNEGRAIVGEDLLELLLLHLRRQTSLLCLSKLLLLYRQLRAQQDAAGFLPRTTTSSDQSDHSPQSTCSKGTNPAHGERLLSFRSPQALREAVQGVQGCYVPRRTR